MPRIEWERGFRRLTLLVSGVLLALGLIAHAPDSVVLSLVAAPWAIFLIVGWLVRGFRSPAASAEDHLEAMNTGKIEAFEEARRQAIIEKGAREKQSHGKSV